MPRDSRFPGRAYLEGCLLELLMAADFRSVPSRRHLHGELFLLSHRRPHLARLSAFLPGPRGPRSEAVASALTSLQDQGLASCDRRGRNIRVTAKGKAFARATPGARRRRGPADAGEVKRTLNELSATELLVFITYSYPGSVSSAFVRAKLRGIRRPRAVDLYRRGIISLEKGAELAGMSFIAFKARLHDTASDFVVADSS